VALDVAGAPKELRCASAVPGMLCGNPVTYGGDSPQTLRGCDRRHGRRHAALGGEIGVAPCGGQANGGIPCGTVLRRNGVADIPRTTRDVTPADVADVVADPRRASVTFVDGGEPAIVPVRARREGDRWRFAAPAPVLDDREVVLLLDDGDWWFELRGVSVRGVARRDGDGWYTVEPRRVLAWSYGSLRLRRV
jgi:hypothetical protein